MPDATAPLDSGDAPPPPDPFVLAGARADLDGAEGDLGLALADVQARLEIARQGRDLLAARLAQAEEAAAAQRRGAEEQQRQARRRAEELARSEQRLLERTAALEEQAGRGRAAEQRLRELESTVARLESELEGAGAGHDLAVAEAALLRVELDQARQERAALAAEVDALREELERLTAATEQQERQLREARDLAAGAAAAEERARALRGDRDELQAALAEALAGLEQHRARVEAQDAELAALTAAEAEASETVRAQQAELAALREARADVGVLTAERDALTARAQAAEGRVSELSGQAVALREAVDQALADPVRVIRPAPPVGHPALAVVPAAAERSGSVVVDLARAAERLRSQAVAASEAEPRGHDEPDAGEAADVPVPEAPDAEEPGAGPGMAFELAPRAASALPGRPWLGGALTAVAERDPVAGARLLLAGLPAQGARVRKPLRYALDLGPQGCHVVDLDGAGGARVTPATPAELDDVAFTLTGSPAALSPLAAGGELRLEDVRLEGGRRGRRRLRKALREPHTLGSWAAAGVRPEPADLLELVASGLGRTPGLSAALGIEGPSGREVLLLEPGEPARVARAHAAADVVVRTADGDLLEVLAGRAPATGYGDPEVVTRVLQALEAG